MFVFVWFSNGSSKHLRKIETIYKLFLDKNTSTKCEDGSGLREHNTLSLAVPDIRLGDRGSLRFG